MDKREKEEIAKLLSCDPAYADQAKRDYVLYTSRGLPLPQKPSAVKIEQPKPTRPFRR